MTVFLVPKNNAGTTLAVGVIDGVVPSWTLSNQADVCPATFPYHLTCEGEILHVTSRVGHVVTGTRGAEGTAPVAHPAGAAVELLITAQAISDLNGAVNQLELDEHTVAKMIATATPANPPNGVLALFSRINGANIDLIMRSAAGVECVICSIVNTVSGGGNTLAANWIE